MSVESDQKIWLCEICHTDEYFPLMIVLCGHSFCENCLKNISNCPLCRTKFNHYDCQPNYSLAKQSSSGTPMAKRELNVDQQLIDLVRMKRGQVKSETNMLLQSIIKSLQEQLIDDPRKLSYECQLESDYDIEMLSLLREKLANYGLALDLSSELMVNKVKVRFQMLKTKLPTNEPIQQNLYPIYDLIMHMIPPVNETNY